MNLRDLKVFVITRMDHRLTEHGIDVNQITEIKIFDRRLPPDDSEVWSLSPLLFEFDYETVCDMLNRWINNQIIACYMTDDLDRDLSIEIMGNGKGMMAI